MIRHGRFLYLAVFVALLIALVAQGCAGQAQPSPAAPTTAPAAPTKAPAAPGAPTAAPAKATAAPQAAAPAGKLVIAIGGDPTTLDPQQADDGNERTVNDQIYETLLTRDFSGKLQPLLATSYAEKDATTWEFKLRSGVKFQNGEDFNADAVVASVKRVMDPKFNSEQLSYYQGIKEAKAVDPLTVQIITDGPDPILPAQMYWMKMVPAKYSQDKDFNIKPVGTGPYKFVSWQKGSQVTIEAWDGYWGTKPAIKSVMIRPIKEPGTRLAALQNGEVDLIRDLLPEQVNQAPKVASASGLQFPFVRINSKVAPLNDPRIRQAMNYAVDKESIAKNLYGGYATVAQGQLLRDFYVGYSPETKAYPYDVEKAKALLKEAGYKGEQIELVGENGRWLKDQELIQTIAGQLKDVGFNIKVSIYEWKQYLDYLFSQDKQPQMIFVANDNQLFDADRTMSAYVHTTDKINGRVSSYSNTEVDKLIDAARTEIDPAKRTNLYKQAVQIARDDACFIFTVNLDDIYGLSKKLDWKVPVDGRVLIRDMTLTQ